MALCKISSGLPIVKDRDINLVRRLVKDTSWVIAAVDNLRVVEKILKDEEFEEQKKSSDSVNNIISCLQTLDNCRQQLHEELEIQSIRGFIMKQTYVNLPQEIQTLIEVAVHNAKNEGERYYKEGKKEATSLRAEVEKLQAAILQIETENMSLPLEKKAIQEEETEVVEEFNNRLRHKLQLKEKLRKLRERIREQNQKIVDSEADILRMKDNLIEQRARGKKEMEYFQSQIEDAKKSKEHWQAKCQTVVNEYDEVMKKLKASEKTVQNIKQEVKSENRKLRSTSRLKDTYTDKMQEEKKILDILMNKKVKNLEVLANLKEEYEENLAAKSRNNYELEMKIIFEKSRKKELEDSEEELTKVLVFYLEIEENARKLWKTSKDKLDGLQNLLSQYEDEMMVCLNERAEVKDTSNRIDTVLESRVSELKLHIDTLVETLNLKKKARVEFEDLQESILKKLDDIKADKDTFKAASKKLLKELENEYEEKLKEVKALQKDIKATNSQIKHEVGEVKTMQDDHEDECLKKESLIKATEEKAEEQEKIFEEINTKYEELSNPFKLLEQEYQTTLVEYSDIFRKNSLCNFQLNELMVSKTKAEKGLIHLNTKQDKLENVIRLLNEKYYKMLKNNVKEVDEIESEIYKQMCRLKFLKLENQILKEGIEDHEQKIAKTDQWNQDQQELQKLLRRLLKQLKRGFLKKNKKIEELGKAALKRDEPFIVQFGDVLEVINYNISVVSSVIRRIAKETDKLNAKWGNLESMRPRQEMDDCLSSKCSLTQIEETESPADTRKYFIPE